MSEVYPFTENNDNEIFNHKQFANVISSTRQQNNYDHRFTQVNSFGRAASNSVSNFYNYNAVPTISGYEGVDILLKPHLINTYFAQNITGYKLQSGYMDYIYKLHQMLPNKSNSPMSKKFVYYFHAMLAISRFNLTHA
jgi:hypothetical protein